MTDDSNTTLRGGRDRTGDSEHSRRSFLRATAGVGAVAAGLGGLAGGAVAAHDDAELSRLRRDGNRIVDAEGEPVDLHGVNIADPKRVDVTAPARGRDAVQTIDLATDADSGWHANVVRLPVQPVDIGEHQPGSGPEPVAFDEDQLESYLSNHLDAAVEKCREEGAYAIVDYHRHRDIPWTDETLSEEVTMFWEIVADHYADEDHVIFEVFNEPQGNPHYGINGQELVDWWGTWREAAQPWVDTIRAAADNFTLVGSPRFSQATFGAVIEEFDGADLGYTLHLYPAHGPTTPADYDSFVTPPGSDDEEAPYDDATPAHEIAPVFMSEWGYDPEGGPAAGGGVTKAAADSAAWAEHDPNYGENLTEWLATRPVHSTAWCFDPLWQPRVFERPFEVEATGNPYAPDNEVPELAPERPADWSLLGGDYQGVLVRDFVAEQSGVPAEELPGMEGVPRDIDDDGQWEDLNGNGRVDYGDVETLVDVQDSDWAQSHSDELDFDGDGALTEDDVLALYFESL